MKKLLALLLLAVAGGAQAQPTGTLTNVGLTVNATTGAVVAPISAATFASANSYALLSGANTFLSGSSVTFAAGSTLTVNGAFAGTPTGGTLDFSANTLTLPATVSGGATSLLARGQGYAASSNASGTTTITPNSRTAVHSEILTITGTASTRIVVLSVSGRVAGDILRLRLNVPATQNIVIDVRNATAGGTQLTQLTTDTSGDDCALEYVFDGTAWQAFLCNYPA